MHLQELRIEKANRSRGEQNDPHAAPAIAEVSELCCLARWRILEYWAPEGRWTFGLLVIIDGQYLAHPDRGAARRGLRALRWFRTSISRNSLEHS